MVSYNCYQLTKMVGFDRKWTGHFRDVVVTTSDIMKNPQLGNKILELCNIV